MRRGPIVVIVAVLLGLAVRIAVAERQALWADEVFSLADATGHSLEHPAALADPSQGDYVEPARPVRAADLAAYTRHDAPPAGLGRVIRAVKLSDLSPPAYYVALWGWTLAFGTSDASLRGMTIAWWAACLPLLWMLAREVDGRRTAVITLALFCASPLSVYYGTEGRMYSMLWPFAIAQAVLTLRLHRIGPSPFLLAAWVLVAAAGLMTHYFLAFVTGAMGLWLLMRPGRLARWVVVTLGVAPLLLVSPWYVQVPEIFSSWRLTGSWLKVEPPGYNPLTSPLRMAWSFFNPAGTWGHGGATRYLNLFVLAAPAIILLRGQVRRMLARPSVQCLVFWLIMPIVGLVLLDAMQGTYTIAKHRYAIAAMPAAYLLLAIGIASLPRPSRAICLILLLFGWGTGVALIWRDTYRIDEAWLETADRAAALAKDGRTLVLLHSIPSGIAGVARYLPPETPVATWVPGLGVRKDAQDLLQITAGYDRLVVVATHTVIEPQLPSPWFKEYFAEVDKPVYFGAVFLQEFRRNLQPATATTRSTTAHQFPSTRP